MIFIYSHPNNKKYNFDIPSLKEYFTSLNHNIEYKSDINKIIYLNIPLAIIYSFTSVLFYYLI